MMAANKTVTRGGSATLTAATAYTFNITGDSKQFVEVLHHNDAPEAVYIDIATTEAALAAVAAAGDNLDAVAPGERVVFSCGAKAKWIRVISAGVPTITVIALT